MNGEFSGVTQLPGPLGIFFQALWISKRHEGTVQRGYLSRAGRHRYGCPGEVDLLA